MKNKLLILITIIITFMSICTISLATKLDGDGFLYVKYHAKEYNATATGSNPSFKFGHGQNSGQTFYQSLYSQNGSISPKKNAIGIADAMQKYDWDKPQFKCYIGVYCLEHKILDGGASGQMHAYSRIQFRRDNIVVTNYIMPKNCPKDRTVNYKGDNSTAYYMLYAFSKANELLKIPAWPQVPQFMLWHKEGRVKNFLEKVNKYLGAKSNSKKDKEASENVQNQLKSYEKAAEDYENFMKDYSKPITVKDESGVYKTIGKKQLFGPFKIKYSKCIVHEKKLENGKLKDNPIKLGTLNNVQLYYKQGSEWKPANGWGICDKNGNDIGISSDENFYVYLDTSYRYYDTLYNSSKNLRITYKRVYLTGDFYAVGNSNGKQLWGILGEVSSNEDKTNLDLKLKQESIFKISKKDFETREELNVKTRFALVRINEKSNSIENYCVISVNGNSGKLEREQQGAAGFSFKGNISITGLTEGTYALYEECPKEGYDEERWTKFMTNSYDKTEGLPTVLPGHETFYFCKKFTLSKNQYMSTNIWNSGRFTTGDDRRRRR